MVRPTTLRGRLTLYVFLLVAGLTVVALITVQRLLARELTRELTRNTAEQLRYVQGVLRHHERGEDAFVREEMRELEARSGALIEVLTSNGPLFVSQALSGRSLPERSGTVVVRGAAYHVAAAEMGDVRISLALPATSAERLYRTIDGIILALLAVGLIVAGAAARAIAARVVAPLDTIADAAERIQAESLSKRLVLPASTYDEVARLAMSFNQMLERLEAAVERLRGFSADAAHELRTPLAAMKAQVQAALAGHDGSATASPLDTARGALSDSRRASVATRSERSVLTELLREVDRLADLVERLLVMSRVDATSVEREPLDLSDLVVERVERARPIANQRAVQLSVDALDPVRLRGDVMLLRQVVDNLLDNAIKYTAPNGQVRVGLRTTSHMVTLTVADNGAGISPAALPHIFGAFFREDSSRTRATGGAGLGLAIVARVVEAHGGRVSATSEPGHGAAFHVDLPLDSRVQ